MSKILIQTFLWILSFSVFTLVFARDLHTNPIIFSLVISLVFLLLLFSAIRIRNSFKEKRLAQKLATELAGANVRLERIDQIKTEFVSIASHQLRGPVTAIKGYTSMLLEDSYGPVPEKQRVVLERIAEATRSMSFLVEDYLNLSRIEAGRMKYEISTHDLVDLVERTSNEMHPVALQKGITLVSNIKVDKPCFISTDIGKTKQIIQNLIDNAIKYTEKGGVVRVRLEIGSNRKANVYIIDSGIGIAQAELAGVFNKFERAKNANSVNVTGTGLGLYVARSMARAMGGEITVHSEGEGQGSTFKVEFPIANKKPS